MEIKLRYYQEACIEAAWKYLCEKTGNPLLALPTGTGKSVIIAELMKRIVGGYQGARALMLTHSKELIAQNHDKLLQVWPKASVGIYSAGLKSKQFHRNITYAGIQSIYKNAELFGRVDLCIIDEAHLISDKGNTMYQSFLGQLREVNPALKVIGLTATPYRMGLGLLTEGGIFDEIAYDITAKDEFLKLIREGYLSPLIAKRPHTQLECENVKIHGGEFVLSDLQEKCNIDRVNFAAIQEAVEMASDRQSWLVFATGALHCEAIADVLNRCGVHATFVHSKLPEAERDERIRDFKNGKVRALVNMGILTTGFDFPELDCIIMLRPTRSPALWVQMLGRGTRVADGKQDCLVLDYAGNTERLGPINDPVLPRQKGKGGGGAAPVKVCPECFTFVHASVRTCPECLHVFPSETKGITMQASTTDIIADSNITQKDVTPKSVICRRHKKEGKPDCFCVDIQVSLTESYQLYLCFEHGGWAAEKAKEHWRRLTGNDECPQTVAEALERQGEISVPASLKVYKIKGDRRFRLVDYSVKQLTLI